MTPNQFAVEAAEDYYRFEERERDRYLGDRDKLTAIIQSAIEKATEDAYDLGYIKACKEGADVQASDQGRRRANKQNKPETASSRATGDTGAETLLVEFAKSVRDSYVMITNTDAIVKAHRKNIDDAYTVLEKAEKLKTAHNATLQELRDANDNLFKVARKHCTENQLLKKHRDESRATGDTGVLAKRITEYLKVGGLFNPEMMEHGKVRILLMDCLATLSQRPTPATASEGLGVADAHNATLTEAASKLLHELLCYDKGFNTWPQVHKLREAIEAMKEGK